MNGSISTVKEIIYDHPRGPHTVGSLPLYIVVDFPESTLRQSLVPGIPTKYVPIPVTTDRCEKKAITIYKSQGITIRPGKLWERVIVWVPTGRQRRTSCI